MEKIKVKRGYKIPFFQTENAIIDSEELTPKERFVYLILNRYSNGGMDECYPSITTIAKKTGYGRTTIVETINSLMVKGLLIKEKRHNGKGQDNNLYIILPIDKRLIKEVSTTEDSPVSPVQNSPSPVEDSPSPVGDSINKYNINKYNINTDGEDEEVRKVIDEFIAFRKELKKPMTKIAIKRLLNKLNKFGYSVPNKIKCLEKSIMHNWTDIYELQDNEIIKSTDISESRQAIISDEDIQKQMEEEREKIFNEK